MPVVIDRRRKPRATSRTPRGGGVATAAKDYLEIGLVNNMPDTALQATERQFHSLLALAAGERRVRVRLFSLPAVARGAEAATHITGRYAAIDTIAQFPPDALIVTGCEPKAPALSDEPYWASLTELVDWAEHNTISTLWSCLAAHAAVLHLDGISRRRLPQKRSGIYACDIVGAHALLKDVPRRVSVPHSRWNTLLESDLLAHGYGVLTRSPEAGADLFVKRWNSLFVFFQGHPEYDVESLAREYRRDVARYLRGEQEHYPTLPHAYFDAATEAALMSLAARARADRTSVALREMPRTLGFRDGLVEGWQSTVVPVFRNWLDVVAAERLKKRQ